MKFPKCFFRRILTNILKDHELDVEFICLYQWGDNESLRPKHFWFRSIEEMEKAWTEIEDLNNQGYDIHFTVVPRLRKAQGMKRHPLPKKPITGCIWGDMDVGEDKPYKSAEDALARIESLKPLPSIIMESGTGFHPYYLLKEPIARSNERIEDVLHAFTALVNGDKGAARTSRLMRVPNTINWKTGRPGNLARVWYLPKTRYRLKDLETAWNVRKGKSHDAEHHSGKKEKHGQAGTYSDFFMKHVKDLKPVGKKFEALGLCPFHDDERPSFCVNLETGLWKCQSSACDAKGNVQQFCERMDIAIPKSAIKRFPRRRVIPREEEWTGEKVFNKLYKYLTSQIRFTRDWQAVVVTLWAMGTYLHRQFPCYGHLWLNSPTTHSGKTKLLDVLWTICYKAAEPQLEPTSAVLFRFPSAIGGTLLLDEIDNLSAEKRSDVISILNHYHRMGVVFRNVPGKNKKYTLEKFSIYCPKVIAGINNLPDILRDRCLRIYLHRKRSGEKVKRFMPGFYDSLQPMRNQTEAWAVREAFRILSALRHHNRLDVPREADDRLRNILEPLFAIATTLPKWVNEKLVEGAEKLAKDRRGDEEESNAVVLAVQALRENFPEGEDSWRLRSDRAFAIFEDDVPGIETKAQAQALLRRLGLHSRRVRVGKHVLRSYVLSRKTMDKLVERYGVEQEVA